MKAGPGPSDGRDLFGIDVWAGYHFKTGTERTWGTKVQTVLPRSGGTVNQIGLPTAGNTQTDSKTDDEFSRTSNGGSSKTSTTVTSKSGQTITRDGFDVSGGSGISVGSDFAANLSPSFDLGGSLAFHWSFTRSELDSKAMIAGPPVKSSRAETEDIDTTIVAAVAPGAGPNKRQTTLSGADSATAMTWTWTAPGAITTGNYTLQGMDAIPVLIFKERDQAASVASLSIDPLNPANPPGPQRTGEDKDSKRPSLSPGPSTETFSRLVLSGGNGLLGPTTFAGLTYAPSFVVPSARGSTGNFTGITVMQFNSSDNPAGVKGGSEAPKTDLSTAMALGGPSLSTGINFIRSNGPVELQPTESSSGSAAALKPKVQYAASAKVSASVAEDSWFTLASLLGRTTTRSGPKGEMWVGTGVAIPYVASKAVTETKLASEDGSAAARQELLFEQAAPDKDNNGRDQVTRFKEDAEISATERLIVETSALLVGPALGLGGRYSIAEGLDVHASLMWAPVLAGKFSRLERSDIKATLKRTLSTTLSTYIGGSSPTELSTSTATSSTVQEVDVQAGGTTPAVTAGVGGMAADARLGVRWRPLPFASIGVDLRDQLVTGVGNVTGSPLNTLGAELAATLTF